MMKSTIRERVFRSRRAPIAGVLVISAVSIWVPLQVAGYAGEAGSADGPNAAFDRLTVSTHHTHLTRALAYCAGLPALTGHRNPVNPLVAPDDAQLAERIAIYDQLTDVGTLTGQDADGNPVGPAWTNLNSEDWTYTLPTAEAVGCADDLKMVFPITQPPALPPIPNEPFFVPASGAFTHRFGPWVGQFHFPQDDALADDLAVLRAFAVGETETLQARSLYGFGAGRATVWSGSCHDQRIETVATGAVKAGSAEAFGTYLHSLGDSFSHRGCREHWLHRQTPPWYYHTPEAAMQETCGFNDHFFDFGCPDDRRHAGFIEGTVDGGIAVFGELLGYALAHGFEPRVASVDAHGGWLRRQLQRFAMSFGDTETDEAGACRVSFAHALLQACGAIQPGLDGCLPDVDVDAGGTCAAAGQTTGCDEGTDHFPMTPACASAGE
jgi:hypothetical protein